MSKQPVSECWGRLNYPGPAAIFIPDDRSRLLPPRPDGIPEHSFLPVGNRRSYGDVGVNSGGSLLDTRFLDRFIDFDKENGIITVESGLLLDQLLDMIVPHDWFLPVTPGTRFVSVGGALANDVHGKNHHRAGTFGQHVVCFELVRSTGERLLCSPEDNPAHFAATIGGLGLTGLITWVRLKLKPIVGPWLTVNTLPFSSLDEFFNINTQAEAHHEYTVAWIDCLAKIPRGIYFSANHDPGLASRPAKAKKGGLRVPFTPPISMINRLSLKLFNAAYHARNKRINHPVGQHYRPFFYPLDHVENWNRLYGRRGFFQYQCAIPIDAAPDALTEILATISNYGEGSFLAVLKTFGSAKSPGLLSFPLPGATLALDFANRGDKTLALFKQLDHIVAAARGRLYPAKDANMSGAFFRASYPEWEEFSHYIDPCFSSNFWRRMNSPSSDQESDG